MADGGSGVLDRLDEVFHHKWRFQQLLRLDTKPGHLHRPGITWRAGRELLGSIDGHLNFRGKALCVSWQTAFFFSFSILAQGCIPSYNASPFESCELAASEHLAQQY